ncbi:MAG: hypothetical protein WCF14_00330, partial [Nitrososphaeraceae archaeon]
VDIITATIGGSGLLNTTVLPNILLPSSYSDCWLLLGPLGSSSLPAEYGYMISVCIYSKIF